MSREKDIVGKTMVTEENLNQFIEYLDIKRNCGINGKKGFMFMTFLISLCFLATGASFYFYIIDSIKAGIYILNSILAYSIPLVGVSISSKKALTKFKNKYPDFNISLCAADVEQLIDNFKINSIKNGMVINGTSKNDELNKDNKLDYISAFDKMSVDEKIAFLEKEKEFWQQEKTKNDLEHDPIQKQIGTIV